MFLPIELSVVVCSLHNYLFNTICSLFYANILHYISILRTHILFCNIRDLLISIISKKMKIFASFLEQILICINVLN